MCYTYIYFYIIYYLIMKTIVAQATFSEDNILVFAKFKWWTEMKTENNWDIVENKESPYDFICLYYKDLFAKDIASMQETLLLNSIEEQKKQALDELHQSLQENLSVTIE